MSRPSRPATRDVEGLEAFSDWYSEHHKPVVAMLVAATGDLDLALDAADEAFARALDRWGRVQQMAAPTGWTYRVALNVARRTQRRRKVEQQLWRRRSERASSSDEGGAAELRDLIGALPAKQRIVVVLRASELPEQEIADIMRISRSAVANLLARARRTLAEQLALVE